MKNMNSVKILLNTPVIDGSLETRFTSVINAPLSRVEIDAGNGLLVIKGGYRRYPVFIEMHKIDMMTYR